MQVLIVDSSVEIIKRLEEILSDAEIRMVIHRSVSYQEATKLFKEKNPDVVVLDISLPGNESFVLLKKMKEENNKVSVIILSIHTGKNIEDECRSLGADFFFDKYHDFEKIPGVIAAIANRA